MAWSFDTAVRTLWQEARSENAAGQDAVAHVLWNRLHSKRWGLTLAEVCLSEYHGIHQFSGWNRNDPGRVAASRLPDNDPALLALNGVLLAAETLPDPTGGAMFYYAPKACAEPSWVKGIPGKGIPAAVFAGQFGTQLFYKGI